MLPTQAVCPEVAGSSPRITDSNDDLPLPTEPVIATSWLPWSLSVTSLLRYEQICVNDETQEANRVILRTKEPRNSSQQTRTCRPSFACPKFGDLGIEFLGISLSCCSDQICLLQWPDVAQGKYPIEPSEGQVTPQAD